MKKKIFTVVCMLMTMSIMIGVACYRNIKSSASSQVVKNIKSSMFNDLTTVKTTIPYEGENDTPEGICVVNDVIYTTKIHTDGTTTLIKTVYENGKIKHIMPAKNLDLGHANDMTYYNGYIYVAGLNDKFYRVKDNGLDKDGFEKYSVKSYVCLGAELSNHASKYSTASWNITHFTGKYFIFCSSIDKLKNMIFRVGYFDNKTNRFVITKFFTAKAKAFTTLQGLTYSNGYLYQATSDNSGTGNMNKISQYCIGMNYKMIQNNYSLTHYGTFDYLNADKFEIESLDFDNADKLYVLVNVKGKKDYIYKSKSNIEMAKN